MTFDGSTITIRDGKITVRESHYGMTFDVAATLTEVEEIIASESYLPKWERERIAYCFTLAQKRIAQEAAEANAPSPTAPATRCGAASPLGASPSAPPGHAPRGAFEV